MRKFAILMIVSAAVGTSATAHAQPRASVPVPPAPFIDKGDLAVGPFDVLLTYQEGEVRKTLKAQLLVLTTKRVAYREYEWDPVERKYLSTLKPEVVWHGDGFNPIKKVLAVLGKSEWTYDDKAKTYAGTGDELGRPRPFVFAPKKGTPAAVHATLVFELELVLFNLENSARARNKKGYDTATQVAKGLLARATQARIPAKSLAAFDLSETSRTLLANRVELKAKFDELAKLEANTKAGRDFINRVANVQKGMGLLRSVFGGIIVHEGEDRDERLTGWGHVGGGLRDIGAAEDQRLKNTAQLEDAAASENASLSKAIDDLEKEYQSTLKASWGGVRGAFRDLLGLDAETVPFLRELVRVTGERDAAALPDRFRDRWQAVRKAGFCDTMGLSLWSELHIRATTRRSGDEPTRRKESQALLFDQVDPVVATAALVPPDAAFDWHRAVVLHAAAQLVSAACGHQRFPHAWSTAFDPRADYGVRIADAALRYAGATGDSSGATRATRAGLLLQRGLCEVALPAVQDVDARIADVSGHFDAARVYGANLDLQTTNVGKGEMRQKCLDHFAKAVARGVIPVDRLTGDTRSDLTPVWEAHKKEYYTPLLTVRYAVTRGGTGEKPWYSFEVTNNGKLPLAKAEAVFAYPNGRGVLGRFPINYLTPGETQVWPNVFQAGAGDLKSAHRMLITFENKRQTRNAVYKPTPKQEFQYRNYLFGFPFAR